jgi:protein required for attachment to host cells
MNKSTTWVLIADGARGRILAIDGHGTSRHLIEIQEFSGDHSASHELLRDKPARVYESHGAARHAVQPKSDPHRALKHSFAGHIANVIAAHLGNAAFDKLIVVAAPVTLGDLRASFSDAVKAKITAEIDKDLTKIPNSAIADILDDVLPG